MARTARALIVAAVVFASFIVWTLGGWTEGEAHAAVNHVILLALLLPALVLTVLAALPARGGPRAGWICLATGLAGWGVALAVWTYHELTRGGASSPSIADAAYLVLPISGSVALVLFTGERNDKSRFRTLLDGLIVGGSLLIVSWVTLVGPIYGAGAGSRLELLVALAYPISDVVLLTVAAMVLVRALSDQRLALMLLATGMASVALADSASVFLSRQSEYASSHAIEIGWVAGLLLISVAAVAAREAAHQVYGVDQVPSWTSIWLPYSVLLVAAVVAVAQPLRVIDSEPVVMIAALLLAAVVVRQFVAVSENRRLRAVLAEQALHDPLTGLGNRALFNERLWHAMQLRERGDLSVAVILLDLDDFKLVNDTLGHPAGDAVLRDTAERISGSVRGGDTVFRLGGNEFAVLVQDPADYSATVAHRVTVAFDKPFVVAGQELMIHPSVSLAVAEADEPAVTAEELLRRADLAMDSAKRLRVGGVYAFTADMQVDGVEDEKRASRTLSAAAGKKSAVRLLGELRSAIDKFELVLYYQPKVDLRTLEIVGVEALVRWPHPERGVLGPQDFLHLVRRHGMMWPITDLVVRRALDDAALWHAEAVDVPVAVNLFAPLLADLSLPARISKGLSDRGLSPRALTVELTEDLLLGNLERTREVMKQLRQNGIRIAIDDFGQAYSAFSYLRDLPVDEVKLDHSFVAAITSDPRAAIVAQSVLDMARALGLTTVAEGVEDAETAASLRAFGCDYGQGFFYSPALSAEDMLALLKSSRSGLPNSTTPF